MKVIINQKNFKKALGMVEKIVAKNTTLPILSNILLKTENGRLKLSATNLEIGINYVIGAKIEEIGQVTIPARILSDFVNNIGDEKITLSVKNNVLSINSEHYKTQILGFDAKDFPIIPKIKNKPLATIPIKTLKNSILLVIDSIALSEARPELAGILVNFENDKIIFASTDSFRLTEKQIDFKHSLKNSFIIPRSTVLELVRVAGELEGEIIVNVSDNQISFSNDDFEMVSRLVDGNYPDYKKVIPDKFIAKVLINKADLEKNIRLAGLFSSNISDIKIQCAETKTNITAKNSDKGEIETDMQSTLKNQPFEISVNYHYLLDGLKIIDTDEVVIEYTGQGSPLVIKPGNNRKDLIYLIMPLRK